MGDVDRDMGGPLFENHRYHIILGIVPWGYMGDYPYSSNFYIDFGRFQFFNVDLLILGNVFSNKILNKVFQCYTPWYPTLKSYKLNSIIVRQRLAFYPEAIKNQISCLKVFIILEVMKKMEIQICCGG